MEKRTILGLTGVIGVGKTTVSRLFEAYGVPVYNTDEKVKTEIVYLSRVKKAICKEFGDKSYYEKGHYNTSYISKIVFNNKSKLEKLNSIIHPVLRENFQKWCKQQKSPIVIVESAIMFSSGLHELMDKVICVTAKKNEIIQRVLTRNGNLTKNDVMKRLENQMSQEELIEKSDYVIHNSNQILGKWDSEKGKWIPISDIVEDVQRIIKELGGKIRETNVLYTFQSEVLNKIYPEITHNLTSIVNNHKVGAWLCVTENELKNIFNIFRPSESEMELYKIIPTQGMGRCQHIYDSYEEKRIEVQHITAGVVEYIGNITEKEVFDIVFKKTHNNEIKLFEKAMEYLPFDEIGDYIPKKHKHFIEAFENLLKWNKNIPLVKLQRLSEEINIADMDIEVLNTAFVFNRLSVVKWLMKEYDFKLKDLYIYNSRVRFNDKDKMGWYFGHPSKKITEPIEYLKHKFRNYDT